jgi:hypothetical protein
MTKFKKNKKTETRLDLILLCQHVKLYSPKKFNFSGGSLRKKIDPGKPKINIQIRKIPEENYRKNPAPTQN